jgi:hypothetical protein
MRKVLVLAAFLAGLCTACVSAPVRFAGHYDRTKHVYVNTSVGFLLTIPQQWAIATTHRDFTVPLDLRSDQEQVLEAYNPDSKLGFVIVVQQGPLAEITDLVQRMQAVSENQVTQQLHSPQAMDVQQTLIRNITVNHHEAAEWIYTARDTTAGQPIEITVSFYILKVGEHYVYLTFSTPTAQAAASRPAIEYILGTFDHTVGTEGLPATEVDEPTSPGNKPFTSGAASDHNPSATFFPMLNDTGDRL